MNTAKTARKVGVLFIVATAAGGASAALLGSVLDAPDLFASVAANESRVLMAVLLDLLLAGAVVAIAVLMAPILRQHAEGMALGYFGARMVEGVVIVAGALSLLALVTVGQQSLAVAAPSAVDSLLLAARDWTDVIGTQLVFGVTALILNYSFYQSRVVPRFIAVWGLAGAALVTAWSISAVILGLDPFSTTAAALFLPIAVNEMVLAVWLIVRGFNLPSPVPEIGASQQQTARV